MKRYLILCLLLALLIPCLTVPAYATTQGVINAINDQTDSLAEWLGVGLGDIRDLLVSIDDSLTLWLDSISSSLIDIFSVVNDSIYTDVLKPFKDYFITKELHSYYDVWYNSSTKKFEKHIGYANLTPFLYDLYMYSTPTYIFFVDFANQIMKLVNGDTTISAEVQDKVDADSTEASDILDVLDDVTKPEESELEDLADISDYVNAGDVSTLAECLSPFFQSVVFLPCIMLSLIFMLVAYVLYGKR